MSAIDGLLRTADEKGVKLFGITPAHVPQRGLGIVATRELHKGNVLMTVPIQAVRSLDTIPSHISGGLSRDMSLHGLLAAELALQHDASANWASIVPQWTDFAATMPILWPKELRDLLPTGAKAVLNVQQTRFNIDWEMFTAGFPNQVPRDDYLYAWLLVNTRTFFYESPSMMTLPWRDKLALLPVADLFNHADTGCSVSFSDEEGYSISADRFYRAGDEVFTSYGEHSNDVLLVEYGFIMGENRHDKVCLDDVILPRLKLEQQCELKERGYLGNFGLCTGSERMNGNLWIALRLLSCVEPFWKEFVDGGEDEQGTLRKAAGLLHDLLVEYLSRTEETLKTIHGLQVGGVGSKNLLMQRWEQIQSIVRRSIEMETFAK